MPCSLHVEVAIRLKLVSSCEGVRGAPLRSQKKLEHQMWLITGSELREQADVGGTCAHCAYPYMAGISWVQFFASPGVHLLKMTYSQTLMFK